MIKFEKPIFKVSEYVEVITNQVSKLVDLEISTYAVTLAIKEVCLFAIEKMALAETMVRYDGKVCKMEILSSVNKNSRSSKDLIKKDVLNFCKDKYIYNIQVAADKGIVTYIIFYNDKIID